MLWILITVIIAAVVFDFINGFHDTANAVATVISTGVLHARTAIMLAAILNFVGAFMSTKVADFISKKMVDLRSPEAMATLSTYGGNVAIAALLIILGGLVAAILWNLITWYFGIPSSSSHALLGGVVGAAWLSLGSGVILDKGLIEALKALVISPVVAMIVAFFFMVLITWLSRRAKPSKAKRSFRVLQLLSASFMAFSHGSNDAQKAMGVIVLALTLAYPAALHSGIPTWVIALCAISMGAGTAAGGKRIIRTMGHKIISMQPIHGFAAETSAALILQATAHLGVPVSTTHVISGAIMGVGASKRFSAVRWGVAGNIVVAWILTIPICILLGGGLARLFLLLAS